MEKLPNQLTKVPKWLLTGNWDSQYAGDLAAKIENYISTTGNQISFLNDRDSKREEQIVILSQKVRDKDQKISNQKIMIKNIINVIKESMSDIGKSSINPEVLEQFYSTVEDKLAKAGSIENKIEQQISWHHSMNPNSIEVGTIRPLGSSLRPHRPSKVKIIRSTTIGFDLIIGWNKIHISADTCRANHGYGTLSLALCDGVSNGGRSSRIVSRVYANLLSEISPLSIGFCKIFGNPNELSMGVIEKSFRFKHEEKYCPTILAQQLSIETIRETLPLLCDGSTTVVNAIILENGMMWTSSIGDSSLYLFNKEQGMEQIHPSSNENNFGATQALGPSHYSKPSTPIVRFLSKGDIVIGTTDLISSKEFKHLLANIMQLHQTSSIDHKKLTRDWNLIVNETNQADDISIFSYKYSGGGFKPKSKEIIWDSTNSSVKIDSSLYKRDSGAYWLFIDIFELKSKGMKRINDHVAGSLSQLRKNLGELLPPFLPEYEVVQSAGANEMDCYLIMDHYFSSDYIRLDKAILEAVDSERINQIRNTLNKLEFQMDSYMIFHSDIAPSNIFLARNMQQAFLIDLNSLSWPSSPPPPPVEQGHRGMYGSDSQFSNIPSPWVHKLPFRVLDLTLYLLSTVEDVKEEMKEVSGYNTPSEEYILNADQIRDCFKKEATHEKLILSLQTKYPRADNAEIARMVKSLHMTQIYSEF